MNVVTKANIVTMEPAETKGTMLAKVIIESKTTRVNNINVGTTATKAIVVRKITGSHVTRVAMVTKVTLC